MMIAFASIDTITVDVPLKDVSQGADEVSIFLPRNSPAFSERFINPNSGSAVHIITPIWVGIVRSVRISQEGVYLIALDVALVVESLELARCT